VISYAPSQDFDFNVYETARFLRESCLEAYDWMDKNDLIRRVAAHLRTSYASSTAVVNDLLDLGLLEAHYGRYRVRRGSFSV
jgi:hypothetical protein